MRAGKQVAGVQLHVFADASEDAFGAVAYLRHEYTDSTISCTLVLSKTRLAPVKPLTIPRLELQAAVLATRVAQTIMKELEVSTEQVTYSTDSMTELQYIYSVTTRFHTFVSNRIAEIREHSSPSDWRHVPGKLNVADDCSRGLFVETLADPEGRWLNGPRFLKQTEDRWPPKRVLEVPTEGDPEVKTDVWSAFTFGTDEEFLNPNDLSSYRHLLRVTA